MNNMIANKTQELVVPSLSPQEITMSETAERCIMESLDHSKAATITLTTSEGEEKPTIDLPPAALKLIGQLLGAMSEAKAISIVPSNKELTTVEAANFLNVSRPFVIKELEEGRLSYRKVGTHRRISFSDLAEYAKKMRIQQERALDEMADNARELGLDY